MDIKANNAEDIRFATRLKRVTDWRMNKMRDELAKLIVPIKDMKIAKCVNNND